MAEAILEVVIQNLASLIQGEIGMIMGVDKEMKRLSNTLITIQKVLEDAEDQQFGSRAIQNWLAKLNEVAFEIEDILDECATEVSKLKHKGSSRFNLVKKILYSQKMGRRMRKVAEKLDAIATDRHNFHFSEKSSKVDWRRETGSIVNEPEHICGRDEDREKIVDLLLNEVPNCDHQLSVLPIVGVGGLGKTTLAQLVYNDERVSQHFETRLWIYVSDHFDLKTLVKAMIEYATERPTDLVEFAALERCLRDELKNKKYLLILDDVWNEKQEDWVKLRSILACRSKGSSIIVTTRLEKVAEIMKTLPIYCLKELLDEHCLSLFRLRAFGRNEKNHPKLDAIGDRIVKKCAGVPLAAKALGGLLRFKRDEKDWIRVEESEIRNLPEEENSILPVLRLSYRHLPIELKQCFAYCAVFPKGSLIEKQDLVFRWMAHGCISSKEGQEVEDVGDEVWNGLVLRSFFQQVDTSKSETTFMMHDLIHDLAQSIMKNKIPVAEMEDSNSKIREAHWRRKYSDDQTCSSIITLQVTTLITITKYNRLRVLKLVRTDVEELPSSIGKLKHLRYLDLSDSYRIHSLSHALCGLWNLQTLILNPCNKLKSLHKDMRRMTNLRHIFLIECDGLSSLPSRIRELTSLKTLSLFIVGVKIGNQLDELEHLNLGGLLEIKHLERVSCHLNSKKANLVEKPNLRDLVLYWNSERTSSESATTTDDETVLEALEPHANLDFEDLASLEYINEDGIGVFRSLKVVQLKKLLNLKRWLKNENKEMMFPNLERLDIDDCESLILPRLSALKELSVRKCSLLTLSSFSNCNLKDLSHLIMELNEINSISGDALNVSYDRNHLLSIERAGQHHLPGEWYRGLKSATKLELYACKIGSSFPNGWLRHFRTLEELRIEYCSELAEMAEEIRYLHLLKTLTLHNVSDIESLLQGLKHISTLQSFSLHELHQLPSLPDWLGNLASLPHLAISDCPKLSSLPSTIARMGNPKLTIWLCPELRRRYGKEDWYISAHIP